MHELSLMESLLAIAADQLQHHHGAQIRTITLRVGALSGVSREPLEFAFTALTREGPAAGARLRIEDVPVTCYCGACELDFRAAPSAYECPRCGKVSTEIKTGREIEIANMEIT